ncbi:MAG TPA: phosphate ABC transporter substrate-binding protein PstS [Bacteroidia bacterium]|jgi:phosphate transport system substrate-binding protein|nr:phosphate ABC transporter substrate-binding protein PstS [Bacteroidia bacterium]
MKNKIFRQLALFSAIAIGLSSCSSSGDKSATADNANAAADKQLLGAGSTFGYPIYSKMFSEYGTTSGMQTNYQSIGSGGGIKQLMSKTVDFGASDAFLSDDDMKKAPATVVQFPTCLGAVVLSYNLPENPELKFTPDIISGIFMKTITKWNDAKIKAENPGVKLPDMDITVAHRSDGSGTTFIFTDYLAKISDDFKTKIGAGKSVNWPDGEIGGKGNEGVAGVVKQTPGAIGYIELTYALQNSMVFAQVKNSAGNYIKASLESTSNCANIDIPADTRISITNASADQGYPISSFTWILLYKEQKYDNRTKDKATNLVKELWWMVHDGQQFCKPLNYAPLPPKAVAAAEVILKSVTFDGQPVLQ